jgi:endonuclease/exonuclease/phosphatase family metal-dependent hydrolase
VPEPVESFLEAHPDVAAAWYPVLSRAAGRVLALPGLGRWSNLAARVDAVAKPAGDVAVSAEPPRPAAAASGGLTVLSANLWHDWPRRHRWSDRLDAVARLVDDEDVDVVLLQEVARTPAARADERLAARLGMARAYARANGSLEALGFEEGLAVLSRFPITAVRLRQLGRTRTPLARRIALACDLETPMGPVLAVSAHLALPQRGNADQIRALRAWVAEQHTDGPALVGGDFNAPEARREIARTAHAWVDTFRHVHPDADGSTWVSGAVWHRWSPSRRLDYVFLVQPATSPWRVVDAAHLDAPGGPHSDHRAVLARLLPGGARSFTWPA